MLDPSTSAAWRSSGQEAKAAIVGLLRAACNTHQGLARLAMAGAGVDRHLFALYIVARGTKTESPFLNRALGASWRLSTSQQPQQQTKLCELLSTVGLSLADIESPGGGFGPVASDGYGVSYMLINDRIYFHISSRRSCPETDSFRFAANIRKVFADIKSLI